MVFDKPNLMQVQQTSAVLPLPLRHLLGAQNSREQSFVLFHNTTPRCVNLYWIDNKGSRCFYAILKPKATIKANTFITHPWLFRDSHTGEYMHVQRQEIYWPKSYNVVHPTNEGEWIVGRERLDIHLPVDSLSNRCLWHVAQRLKLNHRCRHVLNEMPLPLTLLGELVHILNRIQQFATNGGIWTQGRIER